MSTLTEKAFLIFQTLLTMFKLYYAILFSTLRCNTSSHTFRLQSLHILRLTPKSEALLAHQWMEQTCGLFEATKALEQTSGPLEATKTKVFVEIACHLRPKRHCIIQTTCTMSMAQQMLYYHICAKGLDNAAQNHIAI